MKRRRRTPAPTPQSHYPCHICRRLLAPTRDGTYPAHREPPRIGLYRVTTQPLTGPDQPWCKGTGSFIPGYTFNR